MTTSETRATTPTPAQTPARTLSHSQLETWGQCPRRWYLTKVAKVPQAPSEHLALGSALHSMLEADGNHKLEGHPEGHTLHLLAEMFEALLSVELETRDPLGLLAEEVRATLLPRGLAMLRGYAAFVQPHYTPISCEEQLTATVPGTPVPGAITFRGTLDAITQNDGGGSGRGGERDAGMSTSTLPAGWAKPGAGMNSATKWHYFPAGEIRSLCNKWAFVGEREDSYDESFQNCAECRRKVKALRTAAATTAKAQGSEGGL